MNKLLTMPATVWAVPFLFLFLHACGEDDGEGGSPDILLGASGLIIFLVVVWLVVRWMGGRR